MSVAIVNCGIGNLNSVRRGFEEVGASAFIATDPDELCSASHIVLPGVGAFSESMQYLHDGGWVDAIRELTLPGKKPLLGICLGMQLLADAGEEGGETQGLGLIPGRVRSLGDLGCTSRVPHVGWNEISYVSKDIIFEDIPDATDFYFVHSYAFVPALKDSLLATVPYDTVVAAVVRHNNIIGCQFHPEKSSRAGRRILKNFVELPVC